MGKNKNFNCSMVGAVLNAKEQLNDDMMCTNF